MKWLFVLFPCKINLSSLRDSGRRRSVRNLKGQAFDFICFVNVKVSLQIGSAHDDRRFFHVVPDRAWTDVEMGPTPLFVAALRGLPSRKFTRAKFKIIETEETGFTMVFCLKCRDI